MLEPAEHSRKMPQIAAEYIVLIEEYLTGSISAAELVKLFHNKFLNDRRIKQGGTYEFLEDIFASLDLYTDNPELLRRPMYINEESLRDHLLSRMEWAKGRTFED